MTSDFRIFLDRNFAEIENYSMKKLEDKKQNINHSIYHSGYGYSADVCMCYGLNLIDPDEMNLL